VSLGADDSKINLDGENVLMKYLEYSKNLSLEVVSLLLKSGSNIKQISKHQDSILHFAVRN